MQGEEITAQQRLDELDDVISYLQADKAALETEQWQRIKQMMRLRKEVLTQALINSNDDGSVAIRTKGRVQEMDYWLNFLESVEKGVATAESQLEEMELFILQTETRENEFNQGAI